MKYFLFIILFFSVGTLVAQDTTKTLVLQDTTNTIEVRDTTTITPSPKLDEIQIDKQESLTDFTNEDTVKYLAVSE